MAFPRNEKRLPAGHRKAQFQNTMSNIPPKAPKAQPHQNGGAWDFLTATRHDATFRGIRDSFPDFDLESVRGADGPACLLWRLRVQFDVSAAQEGKPLDEFVSNALRALSDVEADAAEALVWLCDPEAELYKANDAPKVARRLVENWQRAPRFETFTFADMRRLTRVQWIVRGFLVQCTVSTLSADSGNFKSFLALELALCIATGTPFFGREVKQGTAVYVAAEGFYTILERALAWAQARGVPLPENFHILRAPVNVADTLALQEFVATIEGFEPVFIVLDTLSQNAIGLNENSNDEMALFMAGMARLGTLIGAHVMALHHNAKASGAFRGAGAIKANVDTHITLDRPENDEENTVFVRCEKQRGKPFEPFTLRGQEIEIEGMADEYGDAITSLVFETCDEAVKPKAKNAATVKADKTRAAIMEVFDRVAVEAAQFGGVKVGFWKEAVEEAEPPICDARTFWRHRKTLEETAVIRECGTHNGSPTYCRASPTDTTDNTDKTPSVTTVSNPAKSSPILTDSTDTHPLGVSVVSVEGEMARNRTKTKRQKAAAESEPHREPKPAKSAVDEGERERLQV